MVWGDLSNMGDEGASGAVPGGTFRFHCVPKGSLGVPKRAGEFFGAGAGQADFLVVFLALISFLRSGMLNDIKYSFERGK